MIDGLQYLALVKFSFGEGDIKSRLVDALMMVYGDEKQVQTIMERNFPEL